MPEVKLLMPKMGESIMEATILKWLKKTGDNIEQDESILEVATDKVDTEIPSIYSGVLKEILFKEGEVVAVGSPIAVLATETEVGEKVYSKLPLQANENGNSKKEEQKKSYEQPITDFKSSSKFLSPLVKSIAKKENISLAELETIAGSGAFGRVTKNDILKYVQNKKSGELTHSSFTPATVPSAINAEDEIIEMERIRKIIADRMVESKRISPHVTSFVEADLTTIVNWRNKIKADFQKKEGENISFTPIFIHAIVKAIKDFPMINIQVDQNRIIIKKNINIGMAVALPSGNLIVPVIFNADRYSLSGLVKIVNDLTKRGRENNLKPDELSGGTFTISNVGVFGNVMGTPIIMQPQVAILATGSIQKKPAVLELPQGDVIAIRHKMFLSHSYDHRVVDGALGGSFVRRVADYLENFDINQTV